MFLHTNPWTYQNKKIFFNFMIAICVIYGHHTLQRKPHPVSICCIVLYHCPLNCLIK